MSRLAGIITDRPAAEARLKLSSMIGCMLHEPFYSHGAYSFPAIGCYVGWVSHHESCRDCQVAINQDENLILVFVGENFPNRDGWDAAALLLSYETEGERCLRELNGWFAGVVIDLSKQKIVLFNDRYGLHRVYYTKTNNSFAFSSEAKSVLVMRADATRLNPRALGQFVSAGAVLDDLTLFEDVLTLPGGSAWSMGKAGRITKNRYFTPTELECQPPLSDEDFYSALRETVARAVPKYFRGPAPVAVSLTGGLDTRAIMAFGPELPERRAYTYGGMFRDAFDVRISRQVAELCGYKHDVLRFGRDFLNGFPELAEKTVWTTDGTLDVCTSHEIYLSRLAREIAPVRITGNYGSEILRSVSTFKRLGLSKSLFVPEFQPYVADGERSLVEERRGEPVTFAAFKEIPWNLYGRLAAAQTQLIVRSPYTDNDIVSLAYRGPRNRRSQTNLWRRLIADQNPSLASIATDTGPVGQNASARTVLDRLSKYLLFKAEWYYDGGMPPSLARLDGRFGRGKKPPWFVGSHKMEHYRLWLRDELFDWVRSAFDDLAEESPYLNRKAVGQVIAAHGMGAGNFATAINRLLTVVLIQKLFVERRPRGHRVTPPGVEAADASMHDDPRLHQFHTPITTVTR